MVKQVFNKKTSKKVVAALMSAALVGGMAPVTLPTQMVQVKAETSSPTTTPAPDFGDKGSNKAGHTYVDWEKQDQVTAVTSGSIVAYVNGANVKISKDEKFNYKQSTVYTNITGTYSYELDAKKKLKASTGKVIVAVSTSSDYSTGYNKDKKKYNTKDAALVGAKNIAKATIKSGIVTITAGTEAKAAYLHIVDTGNAADNHETLPINIIPAAAKIAITTGSAVDVTKDIENKKVKADKAITKASLNAGQSTIVYANALYTKDNNEIATGSSIEAEVDKKGKDYFEVTKATEAEVKEAKLLGENEHIKEGQPAFKITCKKTKGDGKTSSATITFTCKESGKKTSLKMTGTSQIKKIGATAAKAENVTVDKDDSSKVTVKVSTAAAINVVYTLDTKDIHKGDDSDKTTDKVKISSVLTQTLSDDNWKANGTWDTSKNKSESSNKVTVSLKDDKVTVKVDKGAKTGTYYVVVYTTSNKAGATKVLTIVVE